MYAAKRDAKTQSEFEREKETAVYVFMAIKKRRKLNFDVKIFKFDQFHAINIKRRLKTWQHSSPQHV